MNKRLVSSKILNFALNLLARSVCDATFSEQSKPCVHQLSIVSTANALELILKSKIIELNPELIFIDANFDFNNATDRTICREGTVNYSILPKILKKIGINIKMKRFRELGKKRNQIVHLGLSLESNYTCEVLRYAFELVLPAAIELYGKKCLEIFIEYLREWDEVILEGYLQEQLEINKIIVNKLILNALSV